MSEKYSTDELVEEIYLAFENRVEAIDDSYCKSGNQQLVVTGPDEKFHCREKRDAIIARLRAVDNLKNKSLMKLAADLGVSFSAAKIISDHAREEYDAKITKADQLCEAAIGLLDFIRGRFPKDFESGGAGFTCPYHEAIRKAIADYEK